LYLLWGWGGIHLKSAMALTYVTAGIILSDMAPDSVHTFNLLGILKKAVLHKEAKP
jgi:hypothetical protein